MSLVDLKGPALKAYALRIARFHAKADADAGASQTDHSVIVQTWMNCIKEAAKLLREFRELVGSDSAAACQASMEVFGSEAVRKAAILCSGCESDRFNQKRLRVFEINALAQKAGNFASQSEPIFHVPREKQSGGYRDTWAFGRVRYAQQTALAWLLAAAMQEKPYDFSRPGKHGTHGAAERIATLLAQGYRFWIITDIKSAYPSVKKGHLHPLCAVHEKLIQQVGFPMLPLTANGEEFIVVNPTTTATVKIQKCILDDYPTGNPKHTEVKQAPSQLPQGAAHSSLALSIITDGCLSELKGDIELLSYQDNIAIGAHTAEEAISALSQLQLALEKLPAGPLFLHSTTLRDGYAHSGHAGLFHSLPLYGAVEFVGYRISWDQQETAARIRPSSASWGRLKSRLRNEVLHLLFKGDRTEAALAIGEKWAAAFPLWKDTIGWTELTILTQIEEFNTQWE